MNSYVTGSLIKKLREEQNLTQSELGSIINVTDKTISKWETGKGLPDISILESLSKALKISTTELLSGERVENTNISSNMFKIKFHVCPICHNVIMSTGEMEVNCHGIKLPVLEEEETEILKIEKIEDELYIEADHEMTKDNYISFFAGVSNERVELVKLYPEGNAETRIKLRGIRYIYFYDIKNGLYKQKVKRM